MSSTEGVEDHSIKGLYQNVARVKETSRGQYIELAKVKYPLILKGVTGTQLEAVGEEPLERSYGM